MSYIQNGGGGGGGITINTTTITGGNDKSILFDKAGVVGEDIGFTFDYTNKALVLSGATITASHPVMDLSQTWNNVAVTFTGFRLNVTNTASDAGSLLLDLQVGGSSKFSVNRAGGITTPDLNNTANQSSIAGTLFGSDGNGHVWDTAGANSSFTIKSGGNAQAYLYIAQSVPRVQILNALGIGGITGVPSTFLFSDATKVIRIGDGASITDGWVQWAGEKRVSTQFDKSADTGLATITGLSVALQAGRTYSFRAYLHVSPDAVGGHKYAVGTPDTLTATSIIYQVNSTNNSTNANIINSRQTALGGSVGVVSGTVDYTEIVGTITVNVAGTLAIQFAQNVASGTSSVLVGSFMIVQDMP